MKSILKITANSYIIFLSVFIATFFVANEHFDLALGTEIILPIVIIFTTGLVIWQRKINIADYVLLPVMIIDGYFHLTSPLENLVENSPDWVIAFNLYQGKGMPVIVHQAMGVFLLLTSGWFIYLLIRKRKDWQYYFFKYAITTVTLSIISFSYFIKLFK